MKITYAKFVNFAGIYAGLGVREFELDFSKSNNKIIMLLGGNGAGKTTLLSLLNPYRDTNDERKNYILENENGMKEIHYQSGKDKYEIVHYYGSSNKSFIKKNGEELNENGGVRTFEATLKEEWNLNRDYFKIARLGSNVTTFIDLKTAERKKYMNNFLPDIDDYLKAYEVVNDKFKVLTNSIKSIKGQLEKLDTKDNLTELEGTLTEGIEKIQKDIEKLNKNVNKAEGKIEELESNLDIEGYSNYKDYMNELTGNISALENLLVNSRATLTAYYSKYPTLEEFDDERIQEAVMEYNKSITIAEGNIKHILRTIDSISKDIVRLQNDKTSKNNIIKNEIDIEYIEKQISDKEVSIQNHETLIAESQMAEIQLTVQEVSKLQATAESLVTTIESIKVKHTNSVIEEFTSDYFQSVPKSLVYSQQKLEEGNRAKRDLENKISSINSNSYLLETLEKRPSDCVIDTCPFIVKALDYKNNDHSKLEGLYVELDKVEKSIPTFEKEIREKEAIINYIDDLVSLHKYLDNELVIEYILGELSMENVIELMTYDISKIQNLFDVSDTVKIVNAKVELANDIEKLENLQSHLEVAKKQNAVVEQAKQELNDINSQIEQQKENIEELETSKAKNEKAIRNNKIKLDIVNKIRSERDTIGESTNKLTQYKAEYDKRISIVESIKNEEKQIALNNSFIGSKEKELKPLQEKLKQVQKDLIIIDDCTTRIKDIEENYENYRIIKDALDPKKGIPLFFIDNYLKDIAVRANDLLDVAYEGQFKIKFDIGASDFLINVFKSDGTFLEDIKQASQGETSLTTISLSLGMIERLMNTTKYDILYLDEIDSTLSVKNRRLFIALLESQLEKLGIEQVFVISHNNEFDSYPVDLILLKENNVDTEDKEFMHNKNIIFKY
jgi:DNA repair exonuclease SbcCD ATPase subunit